MCHAQRNILSLNGEIERKIGVDFKILLREKMQENGGNLNWKEC